MPLVEFRPSGKKISVDDTVMLAEAARRAGVVVELPCGGKGTCGRCRVTVIAGKVVQYASAPEGFGPGEVLSCKTAVGPADCVIQVTEHDLAAEDRSGDVTAAVAMPSIAVDGPLVEESRMLVPAPRPDDGLSDLDRTGREIHRHFSVDEISWSLPVMRDLPEALRADGGNVSLLYRTINAHLRVAGIRPWKGRAVPLGAAVDLGTTTVSVRIVDLASGAVLAEMTGYNDQVHCGEDVISRINYAHSDERLEELKGRALDTVNRLMEAACARCGASPRDVHCAVVSGNTVMTQLFLGITPDYLRLEPYTPAILSVPELRAFEAGLDINPSGIVYVSPSIGSYVGGDITAGLICTDMPGGDDISLFIDVGTNGEIVLGNAEFLMACACSAGPAFEGGGIGCGMRAMEGAINSVKVDAATGVSATGAIGGGKARGICGSGMIDLAAGLFLTGWLDRSGRFAREGKSSAIEVEGRRARYLLASGDETVSGEPLFITEQDIDNIMRAKAAVYSACALLMSHAGIGFTDLSRVYVAGGFGRYLNIENAVTIGLLPDLPVEKFTYLGNTSLEGSTRILLSEEYRKMQRETARRMTYINLGAESGYSDQYSAALFLPHTDLKLFPGVAARMHRK